MNLDELRKKVDQELIKERRAGRSSTIPSLCEKFGIIDDFVMVSIVAELESSGKVALDGFDTVYREDGGAIHLARYTSRVAN